MNELRKYVTKALRNTPRKASRQEQADAVLAALQQQYIIEKRW